MTERESAFCPGHISAFFEICDQAEDVIRKGSRGAGLCISLGARSSVTVKSSSWQHVIVRIDGKESEAKVTKDAISQLIKDRNVQIEVDTVLDLPMEQGFGMSAAGALSAAWAVCDSLDIDKRRAFKAVHIAEVTNKTGLGDVAGIFVGGMEIRLQPGLPPYGVVEHTDIKSELVLSILGNPIKTPKILTDPVKRKTISAAGKRCVDEFAEHRTIDHLFALGMEFVEDAGLISKEVLNGMMAAEGHGMSSMVMLGNSIFCIGDIKDLIDALKPLGPVFRCEIDNKGPRLL